MPWTRTLLLAAAAALPIAASLPAAGQQRQQQTLAVSGNARSGAEDCAGRDVAVNGNANSLRFTGGCRSLSVRGNGNAILAEMAPGARIEVSGSGSTVGWTVPAGGREPTVQVTGNGNRVSRAERDSGGSAAAAAEPPPLVIEANGEQRVVNCGGREAVVRGDRNSLTLTGACRSLLVEGSNNDLRVELAPGARVLVRGNLTRVAWALSERGPEPQVRSEGQQVSVVRSAEPIAAAARAPGGAVTRTETPRGIALTLSGDVLFDFDSDRLRPDAAAALDEVAALIRTARPATVRIVGHTDSVGAEEYNQDLSLRRARSVERWLESRAGVPLPQAAVDGRGEAEPVANNTVPDGRAQNRRVEILLER